MQRDLFEAFNIVSTEDLTLRKSHQRTNNFLWYPLSPEVKRMLQGCAVRKIPKEAQDAFREMGFPDDAKVTVQEFSKAHGLSIVSAHEQIIFRACVTRLSRECDMIWQRLYGGDFENSTIGEQVRLPHCLCFSVLQF